MKPKPATGVTTGACAAAAAKAAAMMLAGQGAPRQVEIALPDGHGLWIPLAWARGEGDGRAAAAVVKDAGDDPDVTHGLHVVARLSWADSGDVTFVAGDGVGTVTKPGLQVPPGEPAINPVPRRMIAQAIRQITPRAVRVEISIPGGREVAAKTFNPRLGIAGGLSILGTTGIVRPYCRQALQDALKCALDVAAACGVRAPVLAPGNIGAAAAKRHFRLADEQLVEVGNDWGFVLDRLGEYRFESILVIGHPGKLAKLAAGEWDTHSSASAGPVGIVAELWAELFADDAPQSPTVEGIFAAAAAHHAHELAHALASRIRQAVTDKTAGRCAVSVFLVNMAAERLGADGDLSPWK